MKNIIALAAAAVISTASVGCVQPRPDTVIVHHTEEKPVIRTKTTTKYVPVKVPSGPSTTIPGSPQQLGNPNSAAGFPATTTP